MGPIHNFIACSKFGASYDSDIAALILKTTGLMQNELNIARGLIKSIKREELNVGTVPTFNMHNIGTVPTSKLHKIGAVPTFEMYKIGTVPSSRMHNVAQSFIPRPQRHILCPGT